MGYALRMVGDATEAEDLTQEAFLLLFPQNSHVSVANRLFLRGCTDWVVNVVLMRVSQEVLASGLA